MSSFLATDLHLLLTSYIHDPCLHVLLRRHSPVHECELNVSVSDVSSNKLKSCTLTPWRWGKWPGRELSKLDESASASPTLLHVFTLASWFRRVCSLCCFQRSFDSTVLCVGQPASALIHVVYWPFIHCQLKGLRDMFSVDMWGLVIYGSLILGPNSSVCCHPDRYHEVRIHCWLNAITRYLQVDMIH